MLKSKKWAITTRLVSVFLIALVIFFNPKTVFADACADFEFSYTTNFESSFSCSNVPENGYVTVTARGTGRFIQGREYILEIGNQTGTRIVISTTTSNTNTSLSFTNIDPAVAFAYQGKWKFFIKGENLGSFNQCGITDKNYDYTFSSIRDWSANVFASQSRDGKMCYGFPTGCLEAGIPTTISVESVKMCGKSYANKAILIGYPGGEVSRTTDAQGNITGAPITFTSGSSGRVKVVVLPYEYRYTDKISDSFLYFNAPNSCENCLTTKPKPIDPNQPYEYKICDQINGDLLTPEGGSAKDACLQCVGGNELGREGIWTAIGCIPRDPEKIVKSLLRLGLGMGGGFALIIILASGFVLSVSQGEPNRINEAKQWLTSALVGLLFIIFSVTLLHFIGYTIFKLPGFGGS